jgi:N-formylglutamate amidohydrolase
VRRQWGHGFLIDVHGQTAEQETIFRGTDNRTTVRSLIERHGIHALSGPKSILGRLQAAGYRVVPDLSGQERERQYTGGYTTRTYGSHRGTNVDAMQLELGATLRKPTSNGLWRTGARDCGLHQRISAACRGCEDRPGAPLEAIKFTPSVKDP